MIQKSIFQKRINQPTRKIIITQQNTKNESQNITFLKDISNSIKLPQNLTSQIDYKTLYEQQKNINMQLNQRIQLLQQKIKLLETQNIQLRQNCSHNKQDYHQPSLTYISLNKKSQKQIFFEQIRSFKQNLPNSMKVIEFEQLNNFQSLNFMTDQQIMSKNDFNHDIELNGKNVQNNSLENLEKQNNFTFNEVKSMPTSSVTIKIINDQSLIDCMALYGLSEEIKYNEDQDDYFFQGELKYCSKAPHQIVKHSPKLIFPDKINNQSVKFYTDQQAVQNAISLIFQTLKSLQLKAFTLIFQPAIMPNDDQDDQGQLFKQLNKESQIINLINKQRRFYAICVAFEDFDLVQKNIGNRFPEIQFENSLEEDIFKYNINEIQNIQNKSQKSSTKSKDSSIIEKSHSQSVNQKQNNYSIRISKKVLTFFTKYPFIPFFEQLLIFSLKQSFESRKQQMKKNLSELKNFDHTKSIEFLKKFYQNLSQQFKLNQKLKSKINQIFEIKFFSARLNRFESLSLQLSKTLLKNYYSEIWAYPVLRLFTLDHFLDTLTLIMLEEKIIFVCQNEHILTSAIFLFTKVFIKPFDYPYPVVSIIPNQYDYFNAPFPIVYGCLNSKQNLMRQKIPKIYKNVYIILSPNGIQILTHKNGSRIQSRKSPKLRDKLLPCFIKMQNHQKSCNQQKQVNIPRFSGLSSLLGLNTSLISSQPEKSSKNKFIFSNNNRQISHQIIEKVHHYLNGIKQKLPLKKQVQQIKQSIQDQIKLLNPSQARNIDIDKETYQRVKNKLLKKTSDPFVQKFLQTQIVGMQILK